MPSITCVILPSRAPDLDRAIYQIKAQTMYPSSIIVCANIGQAPSDETTRISSREDVLLFAGYNKLRQKFDAFPSYYLLPKCLNTIRSDYVYVSRDSDVMHPRSLEHMSNRMSKNPGTVVVVANMFLRARREIVPGNKTINPETCTFSNTLMFTRAVRASLEYWTPSASVCNDFDLIAQVMKHGDSVAMKELLLESDPDNWGA